MMQAGMFIADGLRSQHSSMSQGVKNANDAIGVLNIIDKAIDEQIKLLDLMKQKAIQSAQASQSGATREALQREVSSLVDRLDGIAFGTRFNGASLLSGSYSNKEFQVGVKSHESISTSVGATNSLKLGSTLFTTGNYVEKSGIVNDLEFVGVRNRDVTLESVVISTSAGTGLGQLAKIINSNSDALGGVRAHAKVITTGTNSVSSGTALTNFTINGTNIGSFSNLKDNDADGSLVNAINSATGSTGVEASISVDGKLTLRSTDGRGIVLTNNTAAVTGINNISNYGRISLVREGANDIIMKGGDVAGLNIRSTAHITLSGIQKKLTQAQAAAAGLSPNKVIDAQNVNGVSPGLLTLGGSMTMMDVIDTALAHLDKIRAGVGSANKGFEVVKNYMQSAIVETKAAESQIRDVDFAAESAFFQRKSVLAQSGNYALVQANGLSQLVTKLFQ
jgi:flagellin